MEEYTTYSPEETIALGEKIGKELPANAIVCFFGDLAAGKTTFIKGLAAGVASCDIEQIHSPTFVYLNIYEGKRVVYHFDLYRLKSAQEFLGMGFDEYLFAGGVSCIEWSERISALVASSWIRVEMIHAGENIRKIAIGRGDD